MKFSDVIIPRSAYNAAQPETRLTGQADVDRLLQNPAAAAALGGGNQAFQRYKAANNIITDGGGNVQADGTWNKADDLWKELAIGAALVGSAGIAAPMIMGGMGAAGAVGGGASAAAGAAGTAGATAAGGSMGLGSLISKYAPMIGNIGDVASSIAKGRGEGRQAEANYGLSRDAIAQRSASANIDADSTRTRQAILLSLLSGMQDAQITPPSHIADRMPQMSGGFKPSAIQGREQIVAAMRPRIMQSLLTGQHMPNMTPEPQAGGFDALLSGLGMGGSLLGALGHKGVQAPIAAPPPAAPAPGGQVADDDFARRHGVRFG